MGIITIPSDHLNRMDWLDLIAWVPNVRNTVF